MTPSASSLTTDEIRTDLSTRDARLKWVVVVDPALPAGLVANATACLAAAVGKALPNCWGPTGRTPRAPYTRAALGGLLGAVRPGGADRRAARQAAAKEGLLVVDMPEAAQTSRVYDAYLESLAATPGADLRYYAVSVVGPRNKVDKLVGRLPLLR
ncbi:DUF2000 domain-containing protein [Streptomyces sp. M19]